MILAELRGLIAVVVVGVLIAVLFVRISEYGEEETVAAESLIATTTSSTSTTSTTVAVPLVFDALEAIGVLCESANEYVESVNSDINYPGKLPQLGEEFYAKVVDVVPTEVRAEYDAAYRYYTEYNDLAEPHGYDGLTILLSDGGERWGALVNGTPPGIDATRANVAFLCEQLELPDPPLMSAGEFERLSDIAKDRRGDN